MTFTNENGRATMVNIFKLACLEIFKIIAMNIYKEYLKMSEMIYTMKEKVFCS